MPPIGFENEFKIPRKCKINNGSAMNENRIIKMFNFFVPSLLNTYVNNIRKVRIIVIASAV